MKVLGFDLYKDLDFLSKHKEVIFVDTLETIYEHADVISLHLPHTPKTEHLINREVIFKKLKNNPY